MTKYWRPPGSVPNAKMSMMLRLRILLTARASEMKREITSGSEVNCRLSTFTAAILPMSGCSEA